MSCKQRRPSASNLHHNPSTSFSTVSSAASATSIGSTRSGGSRLLFGEIDLTSDRSSETVASVCSLVLSDSSTFLRFWLTDRCREQVISSLPKRDLANVRLVCHDFSTRCAPTLFESLNVTFKASTFTRPSRLAALDSLGYRVKHLTFSIPHTPETPLPPVIHPETGEELNFTYTPQTGHAQSRQAKYGDEDITELLMQQYPPLFHAATNVPAFIRGISSLANLKHLEISCPGSTADTQVRRSTVDYALISLRIAIERNCLNSLDSMTISPIHAGGILALSPLTGCGATPASSKKWACIKQLSISMFNPRLANHSKAARQHDNPNKLLLSYLSTFQHSLLSLHFTWLGTKGPLPLTRTISSQPNGSPSHHDRNTKPTLYFPRLATLHISNANAKSSELRALAMQHASTLQTLELTDVNLTEGSWEESFAPLLKPVHKRHRPPTKRHDIEEMADIPIMFALPSPQGPPTPPKPSPARSQTRPQLQRIHPSQRPEGHVQMQTPKPTPAPRVAPSVVFARSSGVAPARMAPREIIKPAQATKKAGILSRVARGVKRTFGG